MKRRDRWDSGRLSGRGWKLIVDVTVGGGHGLYVWGALGRRYFWVKIIRGSVS